MTELPEMLVHWVPTPILALGFWWLLRRTFHEFEQKLSNIFGKLETSIEQAQEHDTRLAVVEQRLATLEKRRR